MKLTLTLTGAYAGKTVRLNHHQFVDGVLILEGGAQAVETAARILDRCYGAKTRDQLDGFQHQPSPASQSGNPKGVSGGLNGSPGKVLAEGDLRRDGLDNDDSAAGSAGVLSSGSGPADTGLHPDKVRKIARAVALLDAENPDHWTQEGLPSVEVISQSLHDHDITRKMIEVAAPGLTRQKVAEALEL